MVPKVERALKFAYRDRRVRPRIMRKNNIMTINAAVREHNINYSRFVQSLNNSNLQLNRKVLANMAINEPFSFKAVVDELKIQVR
jgi:large subunit ribosomal protein L20